LSLSELFEIHNVASDRCDLEEPSLRMHLALAFYCPFFIPAANTALQSAYCTGLLPGMVSETWFD